MIYIHDPNGKVVQSFYDDDIFNHVTGGELLEAHPEIMKPHWGFIVYSRKNVADLNSKLKRESITPPIREAHQQQLGIIEICTGDYSNPRWVPITFRLDIGKLRKDWYLECCKIHGYTVTENHKGDIGGSL
jgi:hypothetical protein